MTDAGTHVKDPVATAHPGKVPDDVTRLQRGSTTAEITPGSEAPSDPELVPLKDSITRPVDELAADDVERSQISTSASDTLGGATSSDVSQGIGKPIYGQDSVETHHGGRPGRKREGEETSQFGPQGEPKSNLRDTSP